MDLNELLAIAEHENAMRRSICIRCCTALGCQSAGSLSLKQRLEEAVAEVDRTDIEVMGVGCMGLCGHGPLVRVDPEGTLYEHVRAADAPSIVAALDGGEATAPKGDPQHPFFALAEAHCPGKQRHHRSGAHRVIHCGWRLPGALSCVARNDPGRSDRCL